MPSNGVSMSIKVEKNTSKMYIVAANSNVFLSKNERLEPMTLQKIDVRWRQRFENLEAAHQNLQLAVRANFKTPGDILIQMALIKSFEMTFELSWKTMKDYLNYSGIDVKLPREVIKQAFANALISDGQVWIDMLEERNLMAHTYDEAQALKAVDHICNRYISCIEDLFQFFRQKNAL